MNILFINYLFVGLMVSEIPRVSVLEHYPYSITFPIYNSCNLFRAEWSCLFSILFIWRFRIKIF